MVRRLLAILMAAVLILSGCLGGTDDPDPDADDQDDGSTDGSHGTGGGAGGGADGSNGEDENGERMAVEASLSANVTSGQVPLAVEFTLDASPSGEEVSWELDLGNDTVEKGDELPASVTYTYDVPDIYTVLLTVTVDGRSAQANLTITVEEIPIPDPNDPIDRTNGFCLHTLAIFNFAGTESPEDQNRVDDLAPGTGWKATSEHGTVHITFYRENDSSIEIEADMGEVPEDAAYALGCIRERVVEVDLPAGEGLEWTYQDGFQPEEGEE